MRTSARRWIAFVGVAIVAAAVLMVSGPAGAAGPVGEVYVPNFMGGHVSQFGTDSAGVPTPLPYPLAPSSPQPNHVAVSPNGKYAYALDCAGGDLWTYTVDSSGLLEGALVPTRVIGIAPGCRFSPSTPIGHMLAEPKTGKFLFVSGVVGGSSTGGMNLLVVFGVASNGTPTASKHEAAVPSTTTNAVAVTPNGKFAYVGDPSGEIFEYAVAATGQPVASGAIATPACLTDVAADPKGKFLYATNICTNQITTFGINAKTGALTNLGNTSTAGTGASSVAVAPNDKTLYVTNAGSFTLAQFGLGTNGIPAPLSPATVSAGLEPVVVAVSPSSKNVYVSDYLGNGIFAFAISAPSRLLTPLGGRSTSAPWGIAVRK